VSGIDRKTVERLTEALNAPEDRSEAAETIRALVEKITLRPGPNRGEIDAALHGEFGTIRTDRRISRWKASETRNSRSFRYGSVGILVAGRCNRRPQRLPPLLISLNL